jgi:hypothetical protein
MDKVDGLYYFIEAVRKHINLLRAMPIIPLSYNPSTKIPLIPVDHCARFIALLIKRDQFQKRLATYHLISAEVPTIEEFLGDLNQAFHIRGRYIPIFPNFIHNSLFKLLGIPKEQIPFMFSKLSYDKTSTKEELPELEESTYSTFKTKLFGKSL